MGKAVGTVVVLVTTEAFWSQACARGQQGRRRRRRNAERGPELHNVSRVRAPREHIQERAGLARNSERSILQAPGEVEVVGLAPHQACLLFVGEIGHCRVGFRRRLVRFREQSCWSVSSCGLLSDSRRRIRLIAYLIRLPDGTEPLEFWVLKGVRATAWRPSSLRLTNWTLTLYRQRRPDRVSAPGRAVEGARTLGAMPLET
jgi:hypothetical protein